jgi:hypothetical protein
MKIDLMRISAEGSSRPRTRLGQERARPVRETYTKNTKNWMMKAWVGSMVTCVFGLTIGCRTPSADWNGTWKVNLSKSDFQGPVFTVSVSSDGDYRYDDGKGSFTFRCDGKDWPMGNDRTQACLLSGVTILDLTRKQNGIKTSAYRWELSSDRKIFTSVVTVFRKNGPLTLGQLIASRVSGSDGFAGQWRDQTYVQSHINMMLTLDSNALHIAYPDAGEYIDATLNGIEAPVRGRHNLLDVTYTIQPSGQRRFFILTKRDSKPLTQGSLELSSDGRSITNSWWTPDRPADKRTLIYEKQ